jgi:RHS repeat-associated protein
MGEKLALMNGQVLQKAFVPLPGGASAVYTSAGLSRYRHPDWLGSNRFASTPSRAIYFGGAYAPYGEAYAQAGTADYAFTGQEQDTAPGAPGLYDFLFREYHPVQGRWVSPDPAGVAAARPGDPQDWNRYSYVSGMPLTNVDPLGLLRCGRGRSDACRFGHVYSFGYRYLHTCATPVWGPIEIDGIVGYIPDFNVQIPITIFIGGITGSEGPGGPGRPERPDIPERQSCIARKREAADKAKAEKKKDEGKRVALQLAVGAATGCVGGAVWGAGAGAAAFGVGAVPGAVIGCRLGATAGAAGAALRLFVTIPAYNAYYNHFVYEPQYNSAEIECDAEQQTRPPAPPTGGGS